MLAMFAMLAGLPVYMAVGAQSGLDAPASLTLTQAETTALANQPRMLAAQLRARSSAERVREARAGYLPTVAFNATGVRVADTGTSTSGGEHHYFVDLRSVCLWRESSAARHGLWQNKCVGGECSCNSRGAGRYCNVDARAGAAECARSLLPSAGCGGGPCEPRSAALENRALVSRQLSALAAERTEIDAGCKFCECAAERGRTGCGPRRECRSAAALPSGDSDGPADAGCVDLWQMCPQRRTHCPRPQKVCSRRA